MWEIYKWKAQLNIHGRQQVNSVNYWDTYTLVVAWPMIHFYFNLAILLCWKTCQIDFIMVFHQAPIHTPLYEYLKRIQGPQGFQQPTNGSSVVEKHIWPKTRAKSMGRFPSQRLDQGSIPTKLGGPLSVLQTQLDLSQFILIIACC